MSFDQDGFNHEVGIRLQMVRKRRDMTQAQVAEALGIPRATYANLEGGRQRIAVDILWRAAVLFEVPIEKLVPEPAESPRTGTLESSVPVQSPFGAIDFFTTTRRTQPT